ncbi:MAG: undecaprenyl-phosphate glucose phosphotransferase [Caldilineaceae bacterium]|jgi:exopolysaccharide biosynthesis polyprenyl glycosylphosphotransferase
MQQSLTEPTGHTEISSADYSVRRTHRPALMKRAQLVFVVSLVLLDIGCTWLSFYASYEILAHRPDVVIGPFWEFLRLPAVYSVVLVSLLFGQRMYQRRRSISHLDETYRIFLNNVLATLVTVAILTLVFPGFEYHRPFILFASAINIGLLTVVHAIHAQVQWRVQARGVGDDRVLLIGTGEVGDMLLQKILVNRQLGYHVVGVVAAKNEMTRPSQYPVPLLGSIVDLPSIIEQRNIDEVIIGLPESSHEDLVGIISLCEREKVGIRVFPDVFQIMASEVSIGDFGGLPLLTIRDVALQGWKVTLKRSMDVLVSAIMLVILSPFLLLTALLVKLDSPGPVFYVQERMGLDARSFKMIKFRSMREDAEVQGPGWTTPDDPRRTKLGTLMRRFNVDELPQLVNVLIGDMSLVGPRPERPVYVEQFRQSIPRYMDRHRERAGLTGWAQVNGLRGDTSIIERTKYDLWYIENWSLALDIKILIRTAFQWLAGTKQNAY